MSKIITKTFTHSCDLGGIEMDEFSFSFWGVIDQVRPDLTEEGGEDMQSLFRALKRTLKNRYLITTAFIPRWMVDTFRLLQYCNQVTGYAYGEIFTMSRIEVSADWDLPQADFALVTLEFDRKEQIVQGRCCEKVEITHESTWGIPLCEQHFVQWESTWGTPLCEQEEITWESEWGTPVCEQEEVIIEVTADITWTDSEQGEEDGFAGFIYLRDGDNNIIDSFEFTSITQYEVKVLSGPGGDEYKLDLNQLTAYLDGVGVTTNIRWRVGAGAWTESTSTGLFNAGTTVEVEIQNENF